MSTENKENLSKNGKKIVFNPFPGLRPFKIEESHLFFGREGQSDEVLLKLSQNRFVGVIGPSGSGKSSFIYCGVLPILYGGFLTEVSAEWEVVVMRPGAGPIDNLAESLLRTDSTYLKSEPEERKVRRTIISTLLRSSSLGLVEAIQHLKKVTNKNYLVLVDQFEELFRFKDSRDSGAVDETLAFINLLLEAVAYPNTPIYVALTMRSDFIGECAQFSELTKKINDSHYLIPQMTRDQKRDAIEGPVAVGGAQVTSRLVQRLLNDLGDNPDQLPILQHALMRTFDYWIKYKDFDDEPIDIKHYESIGTMAEALSLHANEAFDELNDEQKLICETLFKAITEKRGESYGIRRPTRLGDIAAISHASVEEVAGVIEKFRAPGRSLLTPAAGITLTARSIIDISHESLMRIWVRLKNWVGDEADAVQMYQRLAEGASMYQRGKAGLWRPPDLQLALNWEAKHKPTLIWAQRYHPAFERTMEFLSHSKKEFETEQRIKELQAKRRLKTARVTAMVMAGLCVVAVGFLLYAFDQQAEAVAQTAIAVENQAIADKNREEADLNADSAKQASIRAQKAAEEALRQEALALIEKDKADSAAAEARRQEGFATENAELATKNADRAELEADRASKEAIRATQEAENARIAQEEATIRRYQAIAKQLALKSVEQPAERADLKGLLARQGYVFNRDNQGYQYDGDIYNGLYFALSAFKDPIASTQYDVYDNNGDIFLAVQGNNTLYSINQAGKILKWNTQSINRKADTIMSKRPGLTVKAAKLTPDNTAMVLAGQYMSRSYVEIVKLANTRERVVITGLNTDISSMVLDIVFINGGKGFYLLDETGKSIKKVDTNKATEVLRPKEKINALAISPDGNLLYGAGNSGNLYRWEVNNGYSDTIPYKTNARLETVAVHPNGSSVVLGDANGLMVLISGNSSSVLTGHVAAINSITFSPDQQFMGSSSSDQTVRVWNLENLTEQPIVLRDNNGNVTSSVFTNDNNWIIAGMYSKDIKFWPTHIEQMSEKICPKLERNLTNEEWDTYVATDIDYEATCPDVTASNENTQEKD